MAFTCELAVRDMSRASTVRLCGPAAYCDSLHCGSSVRLRDAGSSDELRNELITKHGWTVRVNPDDPLDAYHYCPLCGR